jgi:type IV secretory pathway TrbD component
MLRQIALGISVSLVNFAIHAFLVSAVVVAARRAVRATMKLPASRRLVMVTGAAAAVLLFGHVAEVGVWAIFYAIADVAPAADPFYFAFVNYTTLGYGDVVPSAEWRLIGPITAMNGVLLFGWSTAVLFDVIRTVEETLRHRPPGAD